MLPLDDVVNLARGYGDVIGLCKSSQLVRGLNPQRVIRPLDQDLAATFISQSYCQIAARVPGHVYRLVDETKQPRPGALQRPEGMRAAHFLLQARDPRGAWFSPMRPSFLSEYRAFTAIKPEWNLAHVVMECALRHGAMVYVGRAGPQLDERIRKVLSGGAVQLWVPASQFFCLRFEEWWAPTRA